MYIGTWFTLHYEVKRIKSNSGGDQADLDLIAMANRAGVECVISGCTFYEPKLLAAMHA